MWYEVTLAALPKTLLKRVHPGYVPEYVTYYYGSVIDAFTRKSASLGTWGDNSSAFPRPCETSLKLYKDGWVYASKVRQMASREIRKLGLR